MFERRGEWSGFTVEPTLTGWVIKRWGLIQGYRRQMEFLLPYENSLYGEEADLESKHNNFFTVGEYINSEVNADSAKILSGIVKFTVEEETYITDEQAEEIKQYQTDKRGYKKAVKKIKEKFQKE